MIVDKAAEAINWTFNSLYIAAGVWLTKECLWWAMAYAIDHPDGAPMVLAVTGIPALITAHAYHVTPPRD